MAELNIDSDWKKQAQAEKKRLAEQEAQARTASAAPAGVIGQAATAAATAPLPSGRTQSAPKANFANLVQSLVTQILVYLGEVSMRGGRPMLDLDLAKYNLDMLGVLEEKTVNNLDADEKQLLDTVLYEMRMRFLSVASRHAELP